MVITKNHFASPVGPRMASNSPKKRLFFFATKAHGQSACLPVCSPPSRKHGSSTTKPSALPVLLFHHQNVADDKRILGKLNSSSGLRAS